MKFAKAKTDKDSFRALESWVKLKAVLVLPVTNKKRSCSNRKFHEEKMLNWLAGNEEEVWHKAQKVEQERRKSRKGRKPKAGASRSREENERRNDGLTDDWMKKYSELRTRLMLVRSVKRCQHY